MVVRSILSVRQHVLGSGGVGVVVNIIGWLHACPAATGLLVELLAFFYLVFCTVTLNYAEKPVDSY